MQHLTEEQLILFHYRETEDREQIAQHLEGCAGCRRDYENLSHTLGSVGRTLVPERTAAYGSDVWRRLAPQLDRQPQTTFCQWIGLALAALRRPFCYHRAGVQVFRRWCLSAGAIALASAAFLTGRYWREAGSQPDLVRIHRPAPRSADPARATLFQELGDHLERSQLALIELLNSKTNGPVDLTIEQVLARELVDANRLFCRTAAPLGDSVVMSALEDLEHTLVEISNGPSHLTAEQFADLRRRLGPDAVLCKIKVVGAQLRARRVAQEAIEHRS
jgi:hypothetical protein